MKRFLFIFITVLVTLFGVELLPWVQTNLVLPWTTLLASACVGLVSMFDTSVMAQGKVIWNPATGFGVSIEPGCNGVEAFIVLCAALIAFPSSWLHKAWGLVVGFVAIQALNVVRVISLFYLGQWNKDVFDFAHHYLWQGLIMLDVLAVWLLWIRVAAPIGVRTEASKTEVSADTASKSAIETEVIVTGDAAFALPTRATSPVNPITPQPPTAPSRPADSGADRW
jgi:exosortase H (IPTLxxWG-CTERM-specific)